MTKKQETSGITSSMEDYAEAIFVILSEKQAVRAKDIADRMEVKRPSVTNALQTLVRGGLVNHSPYDVITLTERGQEVAREVLRRHGALKAFLVGILGVADAEADRMACGLEHAVSRDVIDRIVGFTEYMKTSPGVLKRWHAKRKG
jgi:DtxR family Mn-dependent transcriptional regulator